MWETIGTQKSYKHILSTSSKLVVEKAQAVRLTSQLRQVFNSPIGKNLFWSLTAMLEEIKESDDR